jgi:hypothetical protein
VTFFLPLIMQSSGLAGSAPPNLLLNHLPRAEQTPIQS